MTYPDRWEPQPDTEQKEDLRAFYEQCTDERPGMFVSGWDCLKFFLKVAVAAIAVWVLIAGWLSL